MSTRLERILDRDLARSARAFDNARVTYTMLRNGLVGLGLSGAVFLPLAASDPSKPQEPPTPTPEIRQINNAYHYHAEQPVGPQTPAQAPNVHIDLETYEIQGAPPMNREWHRTTFSRNGDEFWALPDASFILTFTRGPNWTGCEQDACGGTFSFASERYVGREDSIPNAWMVQDARIVRQSDDRALSACGPLFDPQDRFAPARTAVEFCKLEALDRSEERPDLCIWMRRSDYREQVAEQVALDVRWTRRNLEEETCPELFPQPGTP
jgi:hypothetical protein